MTDDWYTEAEVVQLMVTLLKIPQKEAERIVREVFEAKEAFPGHFKEVSNH